MADMIEQKHFNWNGTLESDFEMVIQTPDIKPDQVLLVKVIYSPNNPAENKASTTSTK